MAGHRGNSMMDLIHALHVYHLPGKQLFFRTLRSSILSGGPILRSSYRAKRILHAR
jgi:hypothetical protein